MANFISDSEEYLSKLPAENFDFGFMLTESDI